jgi:hypothetical protein
MSSAPYVRLRLEELRPPTAEELALFRALESQIQQALDLFTQTFQSEPARVSENS